MEPNSLVDPKFIGVPYKLGGKGFDGADCIGICILWLREQGLDYEYDDRKGPVLEHWWEKNPKRFIDALRQYGDHVMWSALKKFDVVMYFGAESINRFPTMLGVMVENRFFLTSTEVAGSQVFILDERWKNRFFGAIRLHRAVEKGMIAWD